jgi:predicted acyl esterase
MASLIPLPALWPRNLIGQAKNFTGIGKRKQFWIIHRLHSEFNNLLKLIVLGEPFVKSIRIVQLFFSFNFSFGNLLCAAESHEVIFERDAEVTMRDGVVLNADIYRPKEPGKYPVLLERTPYDKQDERDTGMTFAALGYVVILQDVRGRYTSGGVWYPFKYEAADGYDTVEWAASLPYSNGKVGMFGGSYEAATQMLA